MGEVLTGATAAGGILKDQAGEAAIGIAACIGPFAPNAESPVKFLSGRSRAGRFIVTIVSKTREKAEISGGRNGFKKAILAATVNFLNRSFRQAGKETTAI